MHLKIVLGRILLAKKTFKCIPRKWPQWHWHHKSQFPRQAVSWLYYYIIWPTSSASAADSKRKIKTVSLKWTKFCTVWGVLLLCIVGPHPFLRTSFTQPTHFHVEAYKEVLSTSFPLKPDKNTFQLFRKHDGTSIEIPLVVFLKAGKEAKQKQVLYLAQSSAWGWGCRWHLLRFWSFPSWSWMSSATG